MRLFAGRSIAVRLAVSSLFWSSVILFFAGVILSAVYRQSTERSFDERLLVYANDLAADLVNPSELEQKGLGTLGDPRFEIPLSGWYWQVARPDARPRDIRASRSLLGNSLPTLANIADGERLGQIRKSYATGPEDRTLRIVERDIDLGEDGRFVVRVAGPVDEIGAAQSRFTVALVLTFLALGVALGLSTLLQIRFGLKPLIELSSAVADVRRGRSERIAGQYPGDIAPLAGELNLLLEANREILERAPHPGRQSRARAEDAAERHRQRGRGIEGRTRHAGARAGDRHARPGRLLPQPRQGSGARRHARLADGGGADPRGARPHLREDLPRGWRVDHGGVGGEALLPGRAAGFRGDGRQPRRQRLQVGQVPRRGHGVDLGRPRPASSSRGGRG